MAATLTATYDSTISRIILTAAGLNAATNHTILYRWQAGEPKTLPRADTVRGGNLGAHTSGVVNDYEFAPGVANDYRLITYNSSGTVLDTVTAATITPAQTTAWLKDIARPFNNQPIVTIDFSDITTAGRVATFDVLNRQMPIAVTDVRAGRTLTLTLFTPDVATAGNLTDLFTPGGTLFLQTPPAQIMPASGYFAVTSVAFGRPPGSAHNNPHLNWVLTLVEVDAPDASIVGFTNTWAITEANFATWNDVLAAFATWTALEQYVP